MNNIINIMLNCSVYNNITVKWVRSHGRCYSMFMYHVRGSLESMLVDLYSYIKPCNVLGCSCQRQLEVFFFSQK